MKKKLLAGLACGVIILGMAGAAAADLLVDRGLPTANLNNAAGTNRSNVAWAFGADTDGQWLAGDDFTIGGSENYLVDKISVWSISAPATNTDRTFWLGETGGSFNQYTATSTVVTYANLDTYQGSSGSSLELRQYDIALNTVLNGSNTYQFFLDGNGTDYAWLHSSNAALGGSIAQGADDTLLYAVVSSGALGGVGLWTSLGNGWDKASDANIQVYGSQQPVPEPATMLLFGTGLAGLAAVGRRKNKKEVC